MRPHRSSCVHVAAAFLGALSLAALAAPADSDIHVDKAHLKPKQFKIYDGHLSDDQKRCLKYALKQWLFYDTAPTADDGGNRNESNDHVMAAGFQHNLDDAKDHARSSRSMSAAEKGLLKKTYGDTSPFAGFGDPTQPGGGGWFTDDEASADVSIEPTGEVPTGGESTMGWMQYGTDVEGNQVFKGGLGDTLPATLWIREPPADGKSWCYPTDTNADGWITNADAKCPTGTVDYYAIIKHELGHYFSFTHDGMNHFDADVPPPVWDAPHSLCTLAMSPLNDEAPGVDAGSEFSRKAGRIFFASNRPGGYGGRDLWFATWDPVLDAWATPTNCGASVNTPFDETDPAPSLGGALLYFASNRPGGAGGFDLYLARTTGTARWDSVVALPAGVNTSSDETGPQETWDRLYFSSNRPGGVGGYDLYKAKVNAVDNGLWDSPVNLGPSVNSSANDKDPDATVDEGDSLTVLVFASDRTGPAPQDANGALAAGGYDLYRTQENLGSWGAPVNLGSPINTAFNETGPSHGLGNAQLYYACNRPDGHGGLDVFESNNLLARPVVSWNGDGVGAGGTTVQPEFQIFNFGLSPVQLFPSVTDSRGWTLHFNPAPIMLAPGASAAFPVGVDLPLAATPGDTDVVVLQVQAPTFVPRSNHAHAVVQGAASVGGPGARLLVRALPNPFGSATRIVFGLPSAAWVRVEIFDLAGRRVRALYSGRREAGTHTLDWDGRDDHGNAIAGSVFRVRLQAGHDQRSTTLVRVR